MIIVFGVLFFHAYLDTEPGNFQKEEVIESPQDEYYKILFLIESLPLQFHNLELVSSPSFFEARKVSSNDID
jgi:hypothetical protein